MYICNNKKNDFTTEILVFVFAACLWSDGLCCLNAGIGSGRQSVQLRQNLHNFSASSKVPVPAEWDTYTS